MKGSQNGLAPLWQKLRQPDVNTAAVDISLFESRRTIVQSDIPQLAKMDLLDSLERLNDIWQSSDAKNLTVADENAIIGAAQELEDAALAYTSRDNISASVKQVQKRKSVYPASLESKSGVIMYILGLSCFYHDAAVCLLRDGEPIAAVDEQAFTRKKHDSTFPRNAIQWVLQYAGIQMSDIKAVAFYDKPLVKFERILKSHVAHFQKLPTICQRNAQLVCHQAPSRQTTVKRVQLSRPDLLL